MSKIKAYVSHCIAGKYAEKATAEQKLANCDKAILFGKQLAKEFPNIDFYIPGKHEIFVIVAFRKNYLTLEQVLDIDCDIVSQCNFLVVFAPDDYISKGMRIEIDYAVENNIPVVVAVDGDYDSHFKKIVYGINCHLTLMLR